MDEKNGKIAHQRIVAGRRILGNLGRNNNSPGTDKKQLDPWVWVVISASMGFLLLLVVNLIVCFYVASHEATPAFPHLFAQRYLALMAWGFLVPFVWGFSAKWMGIFLGLKPPRATLLVGAVAVNLTGLALTVFGLVSVGACLFLGGTLLAITALRMFEPTINEPKTRGVHGSFPFFVRMAYAWLIVAASLSIVAIRWDHSGGIWGASRHALTVGFVSVMILSVGQRILPAFAGMRQLWSTNLMFAGLGLLNLGCTLRVFCEVLAYQGYAAWAWSILPLSALVEFTALTIYAINIFGTFMLEPSHAQTEPVMVRLPAKIS